MPKELGVEIGNGVYLDLVMSLSSQLHTDFVLYLFISFTVV